jgi:hypothetical protein
MRSKHQPSAKAEIEGKFTDRVCRVYQDTCAHDLRGTIQTIGTATDISALIEALDRHRQSKRQPRSLEINHAASHGQVRLIAANQ